MTKFEQLIQRKQSEHGSKFDASELAEQFIEPFNSGERIEVTTTYDSGETFIRRGTVGITTGWKPAFLLMHRKSDSGSSDVLSARDTWTSIPAKKRRRVRPVSHNIGTISHGTMRPEDLIPDFLYELKQQSPLKRSHRALIRDINKGMQAEEYYDSEESIYDLELLFDALNEYAPAYFYFGAHPGDGSDYGYWLSESFEDEFEGLKVSDLSEVPTGYSGEVLLCNDHGNMSLYVYSRGKSREVWSIV